MYVDSPLLYIVHAAQLKASPSPNVSLGCCYGDGGGSSPGPGEYAGPVADAIMKKWLEITS
jgi:hypothetical protein